jgi:hypothetical protein
VFAHRLAHWIASGSIVAVSTGVWRSCRAWPRVAITDLRAPWPSSARTWASAVRTSARPSRSPGELSARPASRSFRVGSGGIDLERDLAADLGGVAGRVDDGLEVAHRVDEAVLLGGGAGPHAALGERVDLVVGLAAALGDAVDEHLVHVLHHRQDQGPLLVGPGGHRRPHRGALALGERVGVDADVLEHAAERQLAADDADRAGEGVGLGEDLGRAGRDVIAARGGEVTHRHEDRLLGLERRDGPPDLLGGLGAAATAVHAQHDRGDLVVGGEVVQRGDSVCPAISLRAPIRPPPRPSMMLPTA